MTTEFQAVQDGINALQSKLGAELKAAIEKFEGQLNEKGTVANEAKDAVRVLSEKFDQQITDLAQKMEAAKTGPAVSLTAGDEFVKSAEFKALVERKSPNARIEVKNTVLNTATTTSYPQQTSGIVPGVFKPLTIREILPSGTTNAIMVVGTKEATRTNSAAEVAQGAAKAESALTFSQYNVAIETIAHFIKVSNQLLADAPAVVSYIDTFLRYGLEERIDLQLLKGDGTSPNLSGILDAGNFTAFTPTSGANLVESINKAKYALWANGYAPDTVIVNPADWAAMEVLREGAGTGAYLYGAPGTVAGTNPFGVRVVLSSNMTAGQFAIGQFARSHMLWNRQGITVEMGYVNDDFTKNLVTIRGECRMGLETRVPGAVLSGAITGA
jgi:HK97 family phage major capsid protein